MNDTSSAFQIIHDCLARADNRLSVKELCSLAGVSRSGFYAWEKAADARAAQEEQDRRDFDLILTAYKVRGYSKGAKSIYMRLMHMDSPVIMNFKKIRRLLEKYSLVCPVRKANPYRRMVKALKTNNVAGNLLKRQFEEFGPRMVLLTDITYIPYNGTFAYLSTILDAYTRQILIRDHGISLTAETMIHSDQGCHYTSYSFIRIVKDSNLRQSMSRRGNCWDNAPQESFFGHMKDHIREKLSDSLEYAQAKAVIDDYIDYYNNERYQWHLAELSPNEFYKFCTTGEYPLAVPNPTEVLSRHWRLRKTFSHA